MHAFFESSQFLEHMGVVDGAIDSLRTLHKKYELVAITARSSHIEQPTRAWLAKWFGDILDRVIFCNLWTLSPGLAKVTKASICKGNYDIVQLYTTRLA
jgi:5'(3')-deoxyribonucleotidase